MRNTSTPPSATILLLDDDYSRRAAICQMFTSLGYHPMPFENIVELGAALPRSHFAFCVDDADSVRSLNAVMRQTGMFCPILAYAVMPSLDNTAQAIFDGAMGYLRYPFEADELLDQMERSTERWEIVAENVRRECHAREKVSTLSGREIEVLNFVSAGTPNQEIARKLSISRRTVEAHRRNLMAKLGASRMSLAIRLALEAKILN